MHLPTRRDRFPFVHFSSHALERNEPILAGILRIAHEQAEGALASLHSAHEAPEDADAGIHEARKRFKEQRGVLRFVRMGFEGNGYHCENRRWRDAGRRLAEVRQSAVLPRTIEGLDERHPDLRRGGHLPTLIGRLERRHEEILANALRPGGSLDQTVAMTEEARDRIGRWPIEATSVDHVETGVRKVYRRGRRRMAEAYADPTGARFHEWRKRVKYLWYHLRLLVPLWPEVLEPWADSQHRLAELLGDGNDLSDLLARIEGGDALLTESDVGEALGRLARSERDRLWEEARPLGRRLYAEEPEAFTGRLRTYWHAGQRDRVIRAVR